LEGREREEVEASLLGEGREVSTGGTPGKRLLLLLNTSEIRSEGGTKGCFHLRWGVGRGVTDDVRDFPATSLPNKLRLH